MTLHFQVLLGLINLECCLVLPWITASDPQSNAAEGGPASSSSVWQVDDTDDTVTDLHHELSGCCRKTPRRCGLDCTFPFELTPGHITLPIDFQRKCFPVQALQISVTQDSQTDIIHFDQLYLRKPICVAFSRNSWRFMRMPYFRMSPLPPNRPVTRDERTPFEPGMPRTGVMKGFPCTLDSGLVICSVALHLARADADLLHSPE